MAEDPFDLSTKGAARRDYLVIPPEPKPKVTVIVGPEGKVTQAIVHGNIPLCDVEEIERSVDESTVAVFPAWWDVTVLVAQPEAEAIKALRTLVALKDGPRDDHYEMAKPAAWEAARRIVNPDAAQFYALVEDAADEPETCGLEACSMTGECQGRSDCPYNPEHPHD